MTPTDTPPAAPPAGEPDERIVAHTNRVVTTEEAAKWFDSVTQPPTHPHVPIPDDNPPPTPPPDHIPEPEQIAEWTLKRWPGSHPGGDDVSFDILGPDGHSVLDFEEGDTLERIVKEHNERPSLLASLASASRRADLAESRVRAAEAERDALRAELDNRIARLEKWRAEAEDPKAWDYGLGVGLDELRDLRTALAGR